MPLRLREQPGRVDLALKRLLDVVVSAALLILLAPVFVVVAVAIKIDDPGAVFYRCRRVGYRGRELAVLKFRKMRSDASGLPLTLARDDRLTSVGQFLAKSKLDEIPQLWNVLKGDMSLVGPRPEDPEFVAFQHDAYLMILNVRPGITGLSQLAFAQESRILNPEDRLGHYLERLLPQKASMDQMYASSPSVVTDIRILAWTAVAVLARRDVAVHRDSGKMNLRRRPNNVTGSQFEGSRI